MQHNFKVISYCPLHYGLEYFREAISAVINHVDQIIIFYSQQPSYGHGSTTPCPEQEGELRLIAESFGEKVKWEKVVCANEGEHRSLIYKYAQGYDLVLAFDADEVFDEDDLEHALQAAYEEKTAIYFGIGGYINFWRSFNHACYDGYTPIRIINLHNLHGEKVLPCKVYHFSCAQRAEIMNYKYIIHGHADEVRKGWLENVYFNWQEGQADLHPVAFGLWNATPFDKTTMPDILKQHPNYNKEVID